MLIVKSNIKHFAELDGKHFFVSADFANALDDKVGRIIKEACRRAKENSRNTIMPRDL